MRSVRYMGIVCASLVLRRPLAPYYLTYITDPDTPFTAVVEMTSFVDPAEVGGHHLVYLPKYVAPDDPLFEASDEEVRASFLPYLRRMYPSLRRRRRARLPGVAGAPGLRRAHTRLLGTDAVDDHVGARVCTWPARRSSRSPPST